MQIQLPVSAEQLLDQVRTQRAVVEEFGSRVSLAKYNLIKQLNYAVVNGFEFRDVLNFLNRFDPATELSRLSALELALKSGVKLLQFN